MSHCELSAGSPARLGAHEKPGEGVNFAVFSSAATSIDLCLFSPDGAVETDRVALPERTGDIWHGFAPGLKAGQLYGFRAHGLWAPERGHRFNSAKLLLDPYARGLFGEIDPTSPRLLGHDPDRGERAASIADSAAAMAKCVVAQPVDSVPECERPRTRWEDSVIYEAHPKGLTMLHPDIAPELRGTYEALGAPGMIAHLQQLGVTAVELLPIHAFVDDGALLERGLRNYWGYNSIGFFAPEARYFGPNGAAGLRRAIRALHEAGIEVILDVVYNHTAEGDHRGPTLSFRGLDNAAYYRLAAGKPDRYVNDSGCGNTVRAEHPFCTRLILDSLRWWVEGYGVDGFRFDLATSIGREAAGFDPEGGFLDALRQDPVLTGVKLIAEPWDIGPGGYRLGGFPPPFAEWNDQYRDTVRKFWRGDAHGAQSMADRLLGTAGVFDRGGRRGWSSVNFAACHDGFTLADATAFDAKRNQANGEDNRDGHNANYSDGLGVDGPTEDTRILDRRARRRRCILATVLLSQGTPMLLAGDEIANSQQGNNNAYCQDNEIGWVDWENADEALAAFTAKLVAFRRDHPALRQSLFLHGGARHEDGAVDVAWRAFDGGPVDWRDPDLGRFSVVIRGSAEAPAYAMTDDAICLALNAVSAAAIFTLPAPPGGGAWVRAVDTSAPAAPPVICAPGVRQMISGESLVAFHLSRET